MATTRIFAEDGVNGLRKELGARYASTPALRAAILSVLDELSTGWAEHQQGMTEESYAKLEAALQSPIETLRVVELAQGGVAADTLCKAWERVSRDIDWVG